MTRRQKMGCAVLLLASLVCFALGEVVVRLVHAGPKFSPDPECGWVLTPNYAQGVERHNQWGLRDEDRGPTKSTGIQRIVVIGDSFTYGAGVRLEACYPKVLESLLADGVDVVNGGVPGYSTAQASSWLKKFGLEYKPDLIILGFFLGNDVWENVGSATHHVVERALTEKPVRKRSERSFWRRLRNTSAFYRVLKKLPDRLDSVDPDLELDVYWRHTLSRMGVCAHGPARDSWEPGWTIARQSMQAIAAVADCPVVVLAIPDEFQVNPGVRAEVVQRYGINEASYDWYLPNRRLKEMCKELGWVFLDVSPMFEQRIAAGERLYIPPLDAHWNDAGHRAAAEALRDLPALKPFR